MLSSRLRILFHCWCQRIDHLHA